MSTINLQNPKVLKNWIKSQIQEKNGTFERREVLVFRDKGGNEFIVPADVESEVMKVHDELENYKNPNTNMYSHPDIAGGKELALSAFRMMFGKYKKSLNPI